MNLITLLLFIILLIIVHESGHAIAAYLMGSKVHSIVIGYGRRITKFRLGRMIIKINLYPLSGLTYHVTQGKTWLRLRLWIISAGGVFTNILILGVCFLVLGRDKVFDSFWQNHYRYYLPFQMFLYANIYLLFGNLIPFLVRTSDGNFYSDGYNLLKIPFLKEDELEAFKFAYLDLEAQEYIQDSEADKAIELYEQALKEEPDNFNLLHNLAVAQDLKGDYRKARETFINLLDREEGQEGRMRNYLLNNISSVNAVIGDWELIKQAEYYSAQSFNAEPNNVYFMGTRGAVLVRLGKMEEGKELLKRALRIHSSPSARANCLAWLAKVEAQMGNSGKAKILIEKAHGECQNVHFVSLVEKEIGFDGSGKSEAIQHI